MGRKGGNTLENGVHFNHMNVSSVSVICFIGKCLMRSSQDEKKKKRKEGKVYLVSLVSMIHIRCHSNVSYRQLTALVGKRRSHHSYGL